MDHIQMTTNQKERTTEREKRTIRIMIGMYCRKHHASSGGFCPACASLFNYALERIEHCTFKGAKPACAQCSIHCYAPALREQVRRVMRFAGPRMLLAHPLLTALHLKDRALHELRDLKRNKSAAR
jgi:hypothetical protein